MMIFLALGVAFCGTVHASLLHWSSERQGARIRAAYLRAALVRDQSWCAEVES